MPCVSCKNRESSLLTKNRFGLTNVCQTAAVDKELYNSLQAEALQLNYKIKDLIALASQVLSFMTRQDMT